mmetsp:Transcript_25749/g.46637  ORF Transcript_25749/g.46637 Transcript_25749/m.46637 type:complete len:115 (+) Transcript_25749:470-814(+)
MACWGRTSIILAMVVGHDDDDDDDPMFVVKTWSFATTMMTTNKENEGRDDARGFFVLVCRRNACLVRSGTKKGRRGCSPLPHHSLYKETFGPKSDHQPPEISEPPTNRRSHVSL